jgi:Secretion system C-terminal sorting domain
MEGLQQIHGISLQMHPPKLYPNIESVLSAASQTYLGSYHKPTLNGEFGLGPDGSVLAVNDPNGVHIHNAIWGSLLGGGMGSAMTWWWDNYINPQNLYYHFKPLAAFTALVNLKDDNYKQTTVSTAGGGTSDIIVTPGANFGAATSSSFTINADGSMTPGPGQLGQYLFGSVFNTQYHNPPSFTVTYPVSGQFKVITGSGIGTSPQINIYVDGVELLSQAATINTTYTVNVTAGSHVIKVDNLGTDWTTISNYTFTNIGSPVSAYVLKSADTYKAAGWLLNSKYNWQYLQANGAMPPAITGSNVNITGMHNGNYTVSFYSTGTGDLLSTSAIAVAGGTLTIPLPDIAWDIAFTAVENSVLPVQFYSFTGNRIQADNYLYINISTADNVRDISLERSANGISFKSIADVSTSWNSIIGKHQYVDKDPMKGVNFYRLKIIDKDGTVTYSVIVKLVNGLVKFNVYPNPVNDNIILNINEGSYSLQIIDQNGRIVASKSTTVSSNENVQISVANLAHGIYYLSVRNDNGDEVGYKKIIK